MNKKLIKTLLTLILITTTIPLNAKEKKKEISAKEFLRRARTLFSDSAWAKIKGTVQFKDDKKNKKYPLSLDISFSPTIIKSKLIIAKKDIYWIKQQFRQNQVPKTTVTKPEKTQKMSIEDMGISPNDLTFSFLFWKLERDYHTDPNYKDCRLMELVNPDTKEKILIWFHPEYFFPRKIDWYKSNENLAWRTLEFTGFKKIKKKGDDLWFINEISLRGHGKNVSWKTKVKFKKVDFNMTAKDPEPKEFLKE